MPLLYIETKQVIPGEHPTKGINPSSVTSYPPEYPCLHDTYTSFVLGQVNRGVRVLVSCRLGVTRRRPFLGPGCLCLARGRRRIRLFGGPARGLNDVVVVLGVDVLTWNQWGAGRSCHAFGEADDARAEDRRRRCARPWGHRR